MSTFSLKKGEYLTGIQYFDLSAWDEREFDSDASRNEKQAAAGQNNIGRDFGFLRTAHLFNEHPLVVVYNVVINSNMNPERGTPLLVLTGMLVVTFRG